MSKERSTRNRSRRMFFASNEHEMREFIRKTAGSKKEQKAARRLQTIQEIEIFNENPILNSDNLNNNTTE